MKILYVVSVLVMGGFFAAYYSAVDTLLQVNEREVPAIRAAWEPLGPAIEAAGTALDPYEYVSEPRPDGGTDQVRALDRLLTRPELDDRLRFEPRIPAMAAEIDGAITRDLGELATLRTTLVPQAEAEATKKELLDWDAATRRLWAEVLSNDLAPARETIAKFDGIHFGIAVAPVPAFAVPAELPDGTPEAPIAGYLDSWDIWVPLLDEQYRPIDLSKRHPEVLGVFRDNWDRFHWMAARDGFTVGTAMVPAGRFTRGRTEEVKTFGFTLSIRQAYFRPEGPREIRIFWWLKVKDKAP